MEFCETLFSGQVAPAKVPTFTRADHAVVIEKWRKAFARDLFAQTGEWRIGGYDWHIFTFGYAQALTGNQAVQKYQNLYHCAGYVFTHTVKKPACCSTSCLPSYIAIDHTLSLFREVADIYVVDKHFTWTFVFTHETSAGIGPFFCEIS